MSQRLFNICSNNNNNNNRKQKLVQERKTFQQSKLITR